MMPLVILSSTSRENKITSTIKKVIVSLPLLTKINKKIELSQGIYFTFNCCNKKIKPKVKCYGTSLVDSSNTSGNFPRNNLPCTLSRYLFFLKLMFILKEKGPPFCFISIYLNIQKYNYVIRNPGFLNPWLRNLP